ncbi:glycosyltransferase family 4 protein [Qipengyuania sp. 1NDW9]|uniref:glycosyltransferase family 4 protein n=1 Tax=Qipengyuania xiapuensis TaxID=2867236 RepID=UPI001C888B5F|nr:glycosyltransferase family 4 protein [Qipengyuania xiapuensis]
MARHVAILITALGAGGAERVIAQLCAHWASSGREVTVIAFDAPDDPVYHPLPEGIDLVRLDCPGGGVRSVLRKAWRLRKVLQELQPDVLLSFLTKNNLVAALAGLGMDHAWAACERNNPERQKTHPLWNRLLRHAYKRSDAIVCQTHAVKRCFPVTLRDRMVVIHNPVAAPGFAPETGSKRITAVGRLDRQKGFDVLVSAFALVAARHDDWQLDIWGDGAERDALEALIERKGLTGRATLRGTSEEPGSWITSTGIFVLSSRYEGFPNVLGEAMAAGLPIISTSCDFGPEEMLHNDVNGLLVPPEQVGQLAGAMERLITHEDLRTRLGEAVRKQARSYAPSAILPLWDGLVDRLASSHESAGIPAIGAEGALAKG